MKRLKHFLNIITGTIPSGTIGQTRDITKATFARAVVGGKLVDTIRMHGTIVDGRASAIVDV